QFRHGLLDVITVEGNVVGAGAAALLVLGGMAAHVCLGQVEDQPAAANIVGGEAEFVAEERPQLLRFGRIEHRMNAANHGGLLVRDTGNSTTLPLPVPNESRRGCPSGLLPAGRG